MKVKNMKKRKGMTLVELLGVMVVIAILSAIAIGGISAARDSANTTSVSEDLRTYENSIKQVLMLHPEIMKYRYNKPHKAAYELVTYLNSQMESQWEFVPITNKTDEGTDITTWGNGGNGAIACSNIKRDPWGNAYTLYVYFDDCATTYLDRDGNYLVDADSCVYFVIASAGKNGTGVGTGADGSNYYAGNKRIVDAMKCVNNTDGIDDIGLIVRVLNGDVYSATFGTDSSLLGPLKGTQWCFGVPSASAAATGDDLATGGGIGHDFKEATETTFTIAYGGSIDRFYDQSAIKLYGGANTPAFIGGAVGKGETGKKAGS